ncbi:uncharacterized protein EMH_0043460 [Eimeria mitis]|uniref:Uncharacterized protein n=1 Tax=Eimeria mitis TaxID=44415 RepID=U6K620_9EIME|nr:uncharacterized protein EMH_0043460 [Eimeria mitis]CDJ32306.1 hypothetical protein, conserved [Eimeria mitis]
MSSPSEELEKIRGLEAASTPPALKEFEDAAELDSLASIAPGGTAGKSTIMAEAQTTGTADELSGKLGASGEFHKPSLSSRLLDSFVGQHLLSPQSASTSHLSKSYVLPEELNSGYWPTTPVVSALVNEHRSDGRCSTARQAMTASNYCRNGCLNHGTAEQNAATSSSWGVIEEQQHRLESLQQAICYCEERSSMGRALRSREAAVRSRLLNEQLEQQSQLRKARTERNNTLINEAVGFSLRKAIAPHRPAADRLGACLSVLHKHMQRSLSPSEFAIASTTPGIGGTRLSVSPALLQKDCDESQGNSKGIAPLNVTLSTQSSAQQGTSQGREVNITKRDSNAPTSILYEGAADALAARELVQTRATLLLQKQHGTSNNDSLQQLLSLEGEVRGQMALLGAGAHRKVATSTACGEPASAAEDCHANPPIPEETSGLHTHKRLPQSPPQRLIADSQLHCTSSGASQIRCTSRGAETSKGVLRQTNAPVPRSDNTCCELQPAFGEQQWINLARQIAALQEVVLLNQRQHQKVQRKKRPDRQRACSRESMKKADLMRMNTTDSSSVPSDPLDGVTGRLSSPPKAVEECTISGEKSKNDTTASRCIQMKDKAERGRRSAAEERLRRHRQRLQEEIEQNDGKEGGAIRKGGGRRGHNDGPSETTNFTSVPDVQHRDCARPGNAANSQYNNCDSNSICAADTVHKVRSLSGTPLASATPQSREGLNDAKGGGSLTAVPTKTSELTHRPPLVAKVPLLVRPAGTERPPAPTGQLRPYPPSSTPRRLPVSLVAPSAATYETPLKAQLLNEKSEVAGTKEMITETDSKTTTHIQRNTTKEGNSKASHHVASSPLPPPDEVTNILLGIK